MLSESTTHFIHLLRIVTTGQVAIHDGPCRFEDH